MSDNNSQHVASEGMWKGLHPGMGIASKGMVAAFVVFTALNVDFANSVYAAVRGWIESGLNWYYISALTVMLFVCFYLMFSRFGGIRLGDDDSRPEFSNFSWFAMLFSAGVGIGLLFFSIAEPVFYFDNTAPWGYPNNPFADHAQVTEMNEDRAILAMRVTYFHWGFHGWAVYVMIGLCLAYFGFRKKGLIRLTSHAVGRRSLCRKIDASPERVGRAMFSGVKPADPTIRVPKSRTRKPKPSQCGQT